MDYGKQYRSLIDSRKKLVREKGGVNYYESHHIVPRCMGGGDEPENLILLTAKEHFIAHRLLNKLFPDDVGLLWSILFLCGKISKNKETKITSRVYDKLRKNSSVQRIKDASHSDTLPLTWNFRVRAPLSRLLLPKGDDKIRKGLLTAMNLLIWNLLAVSTMGYHLSFPRDRSVKAKNKGSSKTKVSISSLIKAESILMEMGFIEDVVVDSSSPLAKRKRSKIVASQKLLEDFGSYGQRCVEEYCLQTGITQEKYEELLIQTMGDCFRARFDIDTMIPVTVSFKSDGTVYKNHILA